MNVARWGTAIAAVTGVGAKFGWIQAAIAAALLLCLWVTVNVVRNRNWMRESNGHEVSRDAAHHAADSLITTMAAAIGTATARDLALEASNTLDEMAAAGASADELLRTARSLARQFPGQLRDRSRSDAVAPYLPSWDGADRRAVRAVDWLVHTKVTEEAAVTPIVLLARAVR